MRDESHIDWRWGGVVTLAMVLLSLYPHLHFRISRGASWNGSYAAIEGVGDEVAYSAYVNALIDGRPRRSDPYSGRDDNDAKQQPESLFSIQFVPAYVIALSARTLGISAASAFIILTPLAAALTSLILFWLLAMVTRDNGMAAAGTLAVLCLGTVVGGHGLFAGFFGREPLYSYLMFLRRYQPAASFPLFLLYFGVVWRSLVSRTRVGRFGFALIAGSIFGSLVYSYFYLWSAAAAWIVGLGIIWVVVRPEGWKVQLQAIAVIGGTSFLALIPFASLYASRSASLEAVQALESSHRPDLFRLPEILAFAVFIALALLVRRRLVNLRSINVLFALAFAVLPLLVFNQQILSGRSLQPLHYEMFVANYSVLISMILVIAILVKRRFGSPVTRRNAVLLLAVAAFEWGAYETYVATKRSMEFARRFDEARPVALRLNQIGNASGGLDRSTILSSDLMAADVLPTSAANAVLWAPHMMVFSGVTTSDSKERFYQYLYYTGITPERLENILRYEHQYGFAAGLFGFERTIKGLSLNPQPISRAELEAELRDYAAYCESFSQERAEKTELSFLITPANKDQDFRNLDRWYERDGGERIGNFELFRIRLRESYSTRNAEPGYQAQR